MCRPRPPSIWTHSLICSVICEASVSEMCFVTRRSSSTPSFQLPKALEPARVHCRYQMVMCLLSGVYSFPAKMPFVVSNSAIKHRPFQAKDHHPHDQNKARGRGKREASSADARGRMSAERRVPAQRVPRLHCGMSSRVPRPVRLQHFGSNFEPKAELAES